jgi:hypothetical protein
MKLTDTLRSSSIAELLGHRSEYKNMNVWLDDKQGDQIGRNFAIWVIFYGVGRFFSIKNSPMVCAKF